MRPTTKVALCIGLALVSLGRAQNERLVRDDWIKFSIQAFVERDDNRDGVGSNYEHEDNVGRYRYRKTSWTKYGIGPGIHFYKDYKRGSLKLEYTPIYQWWQNPRVGRRRSEWTHFAYGEIKFNSGERTEFYVRDSFKYIDDPNIYMGGDEPEFDPENKHLREEDSHYDNRLSASMQYRLSQRLYSRLSGYWRVRRYDDDYLSTVGDEDDWGVSLYTYRQQTALFSYGVNLAYTNYDRDNIHDLEMGLETYSIGIGGSYKANKYVDLKANFGYERAVHEDSEISDRNYPTETKVEAHITPNLKSRVVLGVKLDVDEGYVFPYVSQERLAFYSMLTYRHTQRISTTWRLDYRYCDYKVKYSSPSAPEEAFYRKRDGSREELFMRAGINYRLDNALTLSAYYSYEDIDSKVTTSYKRNTIGARVKYEF